MQAPVIPAATTGSPSVQQRLVVCGEAVDDGGPVVQRLDAACVQHQGCGQALAAGDLPVKGLQNLMTRTAMFTQRRGDLAYDKCM